MKLSYMAKCSKCGNMTKVRGLKKLKRFDPTNPSLAYIACPRCGQSTAHEVLE